MTLTLDQITAGLRSQYGLDETTARRKAEQIIEGTSPRVKAPPTPTLEEAPGIQWPVRILLPWSHLASDNTRQIPILRHGTPALTLSAPYARAKGLIRDRAKQTLGFPAPTPAAIPLGIVGAVWVPDHRIHDVCNFAKATHDALETVVYTKDAWLYDTRWYRAGVDVDAPRAELTIRPLAA
ncbi:MAG: hypothetical protein JWM95_1713 [Gemmatimonadetes bacterium]|nr:hypothetical protein [Gemmatimonadota bacterium]